jgi:hypothetical protein
VWLTASAACAQMPLCRIATTLSDREVRVDFVKALMRYLAGLIGKDEETMCWILDTNAEMGNNSQVQ